ncbi:MAG: DNA polymerase III subunit gamma/tau [Porticoccus sp.]|nr:DNA polymerase III subunit gamma/tau [Porticoccus sp.]
MSYQVLARKWRPRIFSEMAGQEHVLRALINALDNDRLHHAYLFTGTRGVGKTTIARILAKCLNCEQGVSSIPCGECSACTSIAEGRFVDLIEVDAASRTKVEDTRELLDNVQYAPTVGRFKVYLIDEVHMLSTHSFNALLKTLEEPPPHVKFLLATTDPQKLPVTILSRCLQFNLKNLSPERIVEHLQHVLAEEQVPCEETGLWALARAADGSMRDALSLTDQAIAHGGGTLTEAEIGNMLGTIDLTAIADIARALVNNDGTEVLAVVQKMSEHAPDYSAALGDLLSVWHRVAIAQTVPDALDNRHGDYQLILELAKALSPEDVQLFYQIILLGRRDIPLAPEPRVGFEMVMLRMLAFQPVRESRIDPPVITDSHVVEDPVVAGANTNHQSVPDQNVVTAEANVQVKKSEPAKHESSKSEFFSPEGVLAADSLSVDEQSKQSPITPDSPLEVTDTAEVSLAEYEGLFSGEDGGVAGHVDDHVGISVQKVGSKEDEPLSEEKFRALSQEAHQQDAVAKDKVRLVSETLTEADVSEKKVSKTAPNVIGNKLSLAEVSPDRWIELYQGLSVGGVLQNIAANLVLVDVQGDALRFELDIHNSSLYEPSHQQRLAEVLVKYFGHPVNVEIEVGTVVSETPQAYRLRIREERQAAALESLKHDPNVRCIMDVFGGVLLEKTVKPVD